MSTTHLTVRKESQAAGTNHMDKLLIEGGTPLEGSVRISGAKNAALPAMAAALLTNDRVELENIPRVRDIITMGRLLAHLGATVEMPAIPPTAIIIQTDQINGAEAPYELVKTMRASILTLGPLVARSGHARVSLPGGCAIGARPVDLHLKALEQMGAEIGMSHGYVEARAPRGGRLPGGKVFFDKITVTGTENILMAAALAGGETITDGTLELTSCVPEHLASVIAKLRETGVEIRETGPGTLKVCGAKKLIAADVCTEEYPGFATDMQAQFMALATQAKGNSEITETIFENRFLHASEMIRMGANISIAGRRAVVHGPTPLSGATVLASDLRASASLVLAALVAQGETVIDRVYHIDRGYENIEEKLRGVGAQIRR